MIYGGIVGYLALFF